jgi:sugar-specific transcriptional regulator TrmB
VCHIRLHVPPYVTFKILQFMEIEEAIASSSSNQEQLIQALQERLRDFGLTKNESKIYVFLSKKGPKKAIEISNEEGIPRTETYHLLSTLEIKGIVIPSIQRPTTFSAVKIERAIESIINNQQKKVEELKMLKDDMIELWNSFQNIRENNKSDFSKLESKRKKYGKVRGAKPNFKRKLKEMRQKSDMLDD